MVRTQKTPLTLCCFSFFFAFYSYFLSSTAPLLLYIHFYWFSFPPFPPPITSSSSPSFADPFLSSSFPSFPFITGTCFSSFELSNPLFIHLNIHEIVLFWIFKNQLTCCVWIINTYYFLPFKFLIIKIYKSENKEAHFHLLCAYVCVCWGVCVCVGVRVCVSVHTSCWQTI